MHLKKLCIIILFITYRQLLSAQHYPFIEYTVRDGLPHSQITDAKQDSRGFLWITTRNGVSRFDGIEFRNYYRKDGLLSNINRKILEDKDGNIWIISYSGLSRFDGNKFVSYSYKGHLKPGGFSMGTIINDTVFLVVAGRPGGIVWFRNGEYHEYSSSYMALSDLDIKDLMHDDSTGYFFFTDKEDKTWKWKYDEVSLLSDRKMLYRKEGKRLIFSDGPDEFVFNGQELTSYSGGLNKVYKPSVLNNSILLGKSESPTKINLPAPAIPFSDMESNMWFFSDMNLFRLVTPAFSWLSAEDGLPENTWAIAEDTNNHLWFGSLFGEISEYDGKKFTPHDIDKHISQKTLAFYKGSIRQSDGEVLFATNKGVLKWNGKSFSTMPGLAGKQVCVIYEDPEDKSVLFGTDLGLYHLKNGELKNYPEFCTKGLGVIEGIARDNSGRYWLSGEKGLVLFDGKIPVPLKDPILPEGYTYTIVKDSFGGIWVSSEEGLFMKQADSSNFRHGLPAELNQTANVVAEMDSNHIIVGRNLDICIIDLAQFYAGNPGYFKIYDSSDGFPGNDCLDHGITKVHDGKFLILTSGRAVLFDPRKLKQNNHPPVLHITGILFESDSLRWRNLDAPGLFFGQQGKISLTHYQNSLRIRYTGISLTNPSKVTYQYRLLGNNDIWSAKSTAREVTFNELLPGNYEFQLLAFNADGVVTPEPFSLKFRIIPAFWQTIIFKTCILILIAMGLVLSTMHIARKNIKRKNDENKLKEELTRLQMNSIVKQFEPHFTFNVISSAGSLIMNGERDKAYDYLVKFSDLLRSILEDGSIVIRSLGEEIRFVKNYCELQKMRFGEKLSWEINIDENVNTGRLIPKMTIQTFVENSIKHGFGNRQSGGSIAVNIRSDEDVLSIEISDDGIGRREAEKNITTQGGNGLKTIFGIFNLMNRINPEIATIEFTDLFDDHLNPAGTRVRIIIPDTYVFEKEK